LSPYHVSGRLSAFAAPAREHSVLRPGQIVRGEILKLYPNHTAEMLIGGRKLTARIEASLTTGGKYYFQVQSAERMVHLKKISKQVENDPKLNSSQLLSQLGFGASKTQIALLEELITEQIPFSGEQLTKALKYIKQSDDKQQASKVLKQMIAWRIPMTADIFQALYSKETKTFSNLLKSLLNHLPQLSEKNNKVEQELIRQISLITEQPLFRNEEGFPAMRPKDQFLAHLKQVLLHTGLSYEKLIQQEQLRNSSTIKSLLIQMAEKSGSTGQKQALQLLHFINGLQLRSVSETDYFMQMSLQIPAEKIGLTGDLRLDIEGEKARDGMINPDQCSILFYLSLEQLQETIIDMQIRKRTVAITVYNDHGKLEGLAITLQPQLRKSLSALDYHLTAVTVKPLKQMVHTPDTTNREAKYRHRGVDYRV
jgi:hypothetical protein